MIIIKFLQLLFWTVDVNHKFLKVGSLLYILSKDEKAFLKIIIKNAKIDYVRKNKYIFNEETIENKVLYSNESIEDSIISRNDEKIQVYELEKIFTEKNMSKIAKVLTYIDKLVLYLYYIEEKTDKQIGKILCIDRSAINKRRLRALEKMKNEAIKRGILNV